MYDSVKRLIAVILSILLLILLSPLLILIAILVKLDSPGPVIFAQKRVGKKKKLFTMYKFRTMYERAPKNIATRHFDDVELHITKFGAFLRRTSLDELPQFINILRGDMAFVGPRPIIPEENDLVEARDDLDVYDALPGVTGWAQINGRDLVTVEEKAELDRKYIEEKSLMIDLKIIFLTAWQVVKKDGYHEGSKKNVCK